MVGCELTDHTRPNCEVINLALTRQPLGHICADGASDNQKSFDAIVSRLLEGLWVTKSLSN